MISYKRPKTGRGQPGGGCAIIYNENRYKVLNLELPVPAGVEAAWALFTPVSSTVHHKVKRIAIGTFYVSPKSVHKEATIDHIIVIYTFFVQGIIMRYIFYLVGK